MLPDTRSTRMGDVPSIVAGLPIVNVWHGGHSVGLYKVKQIYGRAMVLRHGCISFPVGTLLDIVDFHRLIPDSTYSRVNTRVVGNDRWGISLAW